MSKLIIVILLASCIGISFKCIKMRHDIVYGKITVDDTVYSCERWRYTKEKRK